MLSMKLLSERLAHIYSERPDLEGDRGQTGFIKASGASKSVVNQWVTDKIKSIDIRYALEIEKALGYSHIWLMTGDGSPKVAAQSGGEAGAAQDDVSLAMKILSAYRLAEGAERRAFNGLVDAILERVENASSRNKA